MGSVVLQHVGILAPWPGIEPMSPALAGGFLATGPPRKPNFKYSCVYMSIPNSPTIPSPHPSFLATISLFSKSVSLFLFCKEVHLYNFFFLDSNIRDVIRYFSFFVRLTSLSMTISRFIHVAANVLHPTNAPTPVSLRDKWPLVVKFHTFYVRVFFQGT